MQCHADTGARMGGQEIRLFVELSAYERHHVGL